MIATLIALAMVSGGDGKGATPKPAKARWDPDEMICKYDIAPGSRLSRRKVCLTAAQWAEWQQTERLNLLRHQFNGAQ